VLSFFPHSCLLHFSSSHPHTHTVTLPPNECAAPTHTPCHINIQPHLFNRPNFPPLTSQHSNGHVRRYRWLH
jgi:hypothetical protein